VGNNPTHDRVETASSQAVEATEVRPERNRILVVDDNRDAGEAIALLLGPMGYQVELAYDGPSGLATAQRFSPHLAMVDIDLPGMDGYELCRRIRRLAIPDLRMVAITGYGQDEYRALSRDAGFDDHAVKPLNWETLIRLVEFEAGTPARATGKEERAVLAPSTARRAFGR
jgi:CheY-like chemotaxis protein